MRQLLLNHLKTGRRMLPLLVMLMALTPMGAWSQSYGISVAGVEVTSENASNVLGDQTASPSVVFDVTTNTLTLNGATIDMSNQQTYAVVSSIENLKVHLKGYNSITVNSALPYAFSYTNADASGTLTLTTENIAEDETSVNFGRLNVDGITDISNIAQRYTIASELFFDETGTPITEKDGWHYTVSSGYYKNVTLTYVEYYGIWQSGIHINSSSLTPESGGTTYYPGTHTLHLQSFGYNSEIKTTMPELIIEVVDDNNTVKDFKYEGDGQGRLIFRKGGNNESESKVSINNETGAILGFANVVVESPLKVITPAEVPAQWDENCTNVLISDAEYYDLTVAGVQVTSANAGNVTGNYNKEERPQVTYNVSTNTLTLDYAELTSGSGNAIEFGIANLKVHLIGESSITCFNENGVAFKSSVAGNTITFTTSATDPGSLFMTTSNEPIVNATASYENGLCYWANGVNKNVKQLYTPNIHATMDEDDNYKLYLGGGNNPDGTEYYYSIDYADASLDDVPVTKAELETGVSLKGACTITAYAKYGDVQSANVTGKLFGFASRAFSTVVGQTIEMPVVIPALDNGMTVTFSADETSIGNKTVIENEGVFTTSGPGKVTFTANIQFGTTYPEDYEILNSDGMLGNLQVTVVPPAPTVSPEPGSFNEAQTVTISSDYVTANTQTASIWYKRSDDPLEADLNYTAPFAVNATTTINAWVEAHDVTGAPFCSDTVTVNYIIRTAPDLYYIEDTEAYVYQVYQAEADAGGNYTSSQTGYKQPRLYNPSQLEVTYSSSNEAVATVDATGKVNIVGVGFTNITATSQATDEYLAGTASFALTVIPQAPVFSPDVAVMYSGQSFEITCPQESADIYYYTDTEGENSSKKYTAAIALETGSYQYHAYAVCEVDDFQLKSRYSNQARYYVYERPAFSVESGSYDGAFEVEITNLPESENPRVCYYFDDDEEHYEIYTAGTKINVTESTTLKVFIMEEDSGKVYKSDPVEAHYIIRQDAGVQFVHNNETAQAAEWTIGEADQTLPELQNENKIEVAFSSSNPAVATVDAAEGTVTAVGVGQTTITATWSASDEYLAGSTSYTLTVYKNLSHESISVTVAAATYNMTAQEPAVTVKDGETVLESNLYTLAYANNTNAALATAETAPTVTITASEVLTTANYYKGSVVKKFTIAQADMNDVVFDYIYNKVYTGEAITPAVSVTLNLAEVSADEYTVAYSNNINVGTATIVLTSTDKNFSTQNTKTGTFMIVPATATITAEDQTVFYTGVAQAYSAAATDKGELVVTYYNSTEERAKGSNGYQDAPVNAGTYYVQLTQGNSNYTSEPVDVTFTIDPKQLTAEMVTLSATSFPYNGSVQKPNVTVADGNALTADDYILTNDGGTEVGTYTVTIQGQHNYTGVVQLNFSIINRTLEEGKDVTFAAGQTWASYYTNDETLELPEGIAAYVVTGINGSVLTVQAISNVPQHYPVLLQKTSESVETNDNYDFNHLVGTAEPINVASIEGVVYVLYNGEFVRTKSGSIPAHRAYLLLSSDAGARLSIGFGEDATDIHRINADDNDTEVWYSLDGRRFDRKPAKKGLYIHNGQKEFVK